MYIVVKTKHNKPQRPTVARGGAPVTYRSIFQSPVNKAQRAANAIECKKCVKKTMTNAAVNEQEASGREQESWRGKGGSEWQGEACCSNWLHTADSTLHNANVPAIIQLSSI